MQNIDREPPTQSIVIRLEGISKLYEMGDTVVKALDNVNLTIAAGEYCAIMGASGSGKSTLMNIIGCLDRPTSGIYYLENQNLTTFAKDDLAYIRNQRIGFVFQQFNLLPRYTALENVMLPMIYDGIPKAERRVRAEEALINVGLSDRLSNRPSQLSGGQQQRVAIARALVNQPTLLLADEPTGSLDTQTSKEVMHLFDDLNDRGIAIVIITHEPEIAAQTHRKIMMQDGLIIG